MGRGKSDQKTGLIQLRPGLDDGEFCARVLRRGAEDVLSE